MPEQPLPVYWTEEVDAKGRQFYSNHITQTTQWERPAPSEHPFPWDGPPFFIRNTRNDQVQRISKSRGPPKTPKSACTPRISFWITAALVLPAWIVSVWVRLDSVYEHPAVIKGLTIVVVLWWCIRQYARVALHTQINSVADGSQLDVYESDGGLAAVDDSWLDGVSLSAVDENILNRCADDEVPTDSYEFCNFYVSFMMMQLTATMFASVALALVSIALFLPASGCCCCSAKRLGMYGGYILTTYAVFQLIAVVLMLCIERSGDDKEYFFDEPGAGHVVGATFWVAVVGYVLAMSDAIVYLYFVGSAGDGLIYEFIDKRSMPKG